MAIESLSPEAQAIIRRAIAFVATTHQLDGEFETRLGVERAEVAKVLMRWPAVDDHGDDAPVTVAINNALNELVNGMDLSAEEWRQIGTTRGEVEAAYAAWATARGWQSRGLR